MKDENLPDEFIATSVKLAFEFEGISDLLNLWSKETDKNEKDEIIADIQELMNDCLETRQQVFSLIPFNDLDAIAKDIRRFKDELLILVHKHCGGISNLSKLPEIPQPSLSRFFNSNAMPQRSMLLKISAALKLDAVKIMNPWVR